MNWLLYIGVPGAIMAIIAFHEKIGRGMAWFARRFMPTERQRDIEQALKALAEIDTLAVPLFKKCSPRWNDPYREPPEIEAERDRAEAELDRLHWERSRLETLLAKANYPGVIPGRQGWYPKPEQPPARDRRWG